MVEINRLVVYVAAAVAAYAVFGYVSSPGGVWVSEVRGESMVPVIMPGETVVCVETGSYEVGDIVVFSAELAETTRGFLQGADFVAHRVVHVTEEGVVTKGVANSILDGFVPNDAIVCEIVFHTRVV